MGYKSNIQSLSKPGGAGHTQRDGFDLERGRLEGIREPRASGSLLVSIISFQTLVLHLPGCVSLARDPASWSQAHHLCTGQTRARGVWRHQRRGHGRVSTAQSEREEAGGRELGREQSLRGCLGDRRSDLFSSLSLFRMHEKMDLQQSFGARVFKYLKFLFIMENRKNVLKERILNPQATIANLSCHQLMVYLFSSNQPSTPSYSGLFQSKPQTSYHFISYHFGMHL